jgi:hypothetical protein
MPDYKAKLERIFRLRLETFDWNCPQHITPRFTEQEVTEAVRLRRLQPSNLDDEVRHIDEMNRQKQADSDAMNAAIQATNAANAAAQQQIQLQQDLANMPLQQN